MKRALIVLPWLLWCLAPPGATAQPIYRCGSAYSQAPCAQARPVDADDSRSAAQLAQAQRVAADDARLAQQMRSDRLGAAAMQTIAGAARLDGAAAAASAKPAHPASAKRKNTHKRDSARRAPTSDFIALDTSRRKKRRAGP